VSNDFFLIFKQHFHKLITPQAVKHVPTLHAVGLQQSRVHEAAKQSNKCSQQKQGILIAFSKRLQHSLLQRQNITEITEATPKEGLINISAEELPRVDEGLVCAITLDKRLLLTAQMQRAPHRLVVGLR